MKWSDLVGLKQAPATGTQASEDDRRLFQYYLCRLFSEPGLDMILDNEELRDFASNAGAELGELPSEDSMSFEQKAELLRAAMRARALQLESVMVGEIKLSFEGLLSFLSDRLSLTGAERKVLTFGILASLFPWGRPMLKQLRTNGNESPAVRALANALRERSADVLHALMHDSKLEMTQLMCRGIMTHDMDDFLGAGKLLDQLVMRFSHGADGQGVHDLMFAHLFPASQSAKFGLHAFAGFADLQLLLGYLSKGLDSGQRGKNVLIYGPPGTGKTELSRTLAEHLGRKLYEVPTHKEDSTPKTGRSRLTAARVAQELLETSPGSLLLFDELEDAFRVSEEFAKGWFNQLLETNLVPTLWISNDIRHIDPAILRRFGLIVHLDGWNTEPSESVAKHLSKLPVSSAWTQALKAKPWMTPALAENLSDIGGLLPPGQVLRNQSKLESVLEKRLSALNDEAITLTVMPEETLDEFPEFRSEWLSTFPGLRNVERGLRGDKSARLCLFGPPGAGKTAYASQLASRLNRPFELVTGSDLKSCMVGETEQNIAAMFNRAESSGAVLLLDEADTFLYSRKTAGQSWEVSATNEFMVRMERFKGVFLATTNRFDALDSAVLRRFDMKVSFGYLDANQLASILRACVDDPESVASVSGSVLAEFDALTPGLVRAAVRQLQMMGLRPTLARLLDALADGPTMQAGGLHRNPIGFF